MKLSASRSPNCLPLQDQQRWRRPCRLGYSEKLRAQTSGLGQAIKNAGDATNNGKDREGALGEVNNLLRTMRDLAIHAANTGATDAASAQADQSHIANAINSLNKFAIGDNSSA